MSKHVEIHIAELFSGKEDYVITTSGVGSCVVIVLYDRLVRVCGMPHAILPHRRQSDTMAESHRDDEGRVLAKYVDQAIKLLIEEIVINGGSRDHLVAKLIGGAHMFVLLEGDKHGIGWENTEAARIELAQSNIPIETEVVGGTVGRNVRFDCATGIVEITTKV